MRKIEQEMITALKGNQDWYKDNTSVVFSDHNGNPYLRATVYLHGHSIAELDRKGSLHMNVNTLMSWPTVTTRSRLNALGFHVSQRKGEQVITTKTIFNFVMG